MPLLEAKNINISFSGIQILYDVDFELEAGEINCLCGGNGAGKSTLVKILSGINSNYTGDIVIDGKSVRISSPQEAIGYGIYAVQQHRDLAPTLNAVENMFMGNELYKGRSRQVYDFAKMKEVARKYVDKFGVDINLDVPVSRLKVSEQGIIAICKALVRNSKILLIDEASAPLDDSERVALYTSLQNLAKEGKGIVYITHHLDEVFRIGTSVTVMRDGRKIAKLPIGELTKKSLIAMMTGNAKLYSRAESDAEHPLGDKILEIRNLNAANLKNINLDVAAGEIVGIAGLEGSGAKDIAEICFGAEKADSGTIRVKGREIHPHHPLEAIRSGIGLVPDDRKEAGLVLCRDISDNISISYLNKMKKSVASPASLRKTADKFIEDMKIRCFNATQHVQFLSGGNQQKVLVAKWIKAGVDILILIEPTEGIDVGARADLYEIFRNLAKEQNKAIIIASSDIDELIELSDRILTMAEGQIVHSYAIENADKRTILADILSASGDSDQGGDEVEA